MVLVCWVATVVACLGYGTASVLQSVGAHSVPVKVEARVRVAAVAAILGQLPYLIGLGLDGIAFVANAVALQRLPLYLVQAAVSASVGVTAIIAWRRGTPLNRWQWSAMGVLAAGLVMLALSSGSEAATKVSELSQWLILAGGLIPLALSLVALRWSGVARPVGLAVASGLAYTGVAVAARGLVIMHPWWHMLAEPLLWAIILHGILGTALFAVALQRGSVTAITAITFAIELVVPTAIGLTLLGDTVALGLLPVAVAGFVLTLAATLVLARYAE